MIDELRYHNPALGYIITRAVTQKAANEIERFRRVRKFLHAYATGAAMTFVNPQTGKLVSATSEARALADACLEGPAAE